MADASADLNIIMRARDEATKAMQAIQKELRAIDRAADAMTPGVDKAAGSMKRLGDNTKHGHDSMKGMDQMMAGMSMTMLGLPLVAVAGQAMKLSAEFETLSNVAQVNARATDEQKKQFEELALQLGKDTVFSAGQAMSAINELSKSGLSVENIMSAMPGVLSMAAAGSIEVAAAAEIASNAMNAFGLSGRDVNRVADILAATANASSSEIEDLKDSLQMVGAVAGITGLKIEEVAAALGLMANRGVKGSDAGTSLKQMFLQLMTPSKEAKKIMQDMGVALYDATGKMKSMRDIIAELERGTRGLTQEQRDYALATIFGSDAVRSASILVAEGVEGYDKMEAAVTRAGAAQEVAEARMKGLSGAIEYFKGSLETFLIQGGTPFNDTLAKTIRLAADLLSAIGELPAPLQRVLAVTVAATGGLLVVGGTLLGIVGSINMMMPALKPVIGVMGRLRDVAGSVIDRVRGEAKALGDVTDACRGAEDGKNKVTEANANLHTAAVKSTKALGDEVGMLDKLRDAYGRFAADHELRLSGININTGQVGGGAMEGIGKMLGGVMAGAIGAAIGSIGVASILSGLGAALAGVASAAGAALASPAALIGLAIAAAIALSLAHVYIIKRAFEDWSKAIRGNLPQAKQWGGAIAKALADGLKNALGAAVSAEKLMTWFNLGRLIGLIAGLFIYGAPLLMRAVEEMLGPIPEWLRTNIARWKDQLLASFGELIILAATKLSEIRNEVIRRFTEAWDWIAANVPTWPGKVAGWLGEIADKARESLGQAKDYITGKLEEAWNWISANVPTWPGRIREFLSDLASQMRQIFEDAKDRAIEKLGEAWAWIKENVPTWPAKIVAFLKELPANVQAIFKQAKDWSLAKLKELWQWITTELPQWPGRIASFLSGIPAAVQQVFEDAKQLAAAKLQEFIDEAKRLAEAIAEAIMSPLRAMIDEVKKIFEEILAGIRQGLEDARKLLPGGSTSSSSSQSATTEKSGSTQSVAVNKTSTQGSTQSGGTTNYGNSYSYGDTIVVQSKSTASMIVNSKRDARIRQLVEAF